MKSLWRVALVRLLVVFAVVFAAYNPSGFSYVHWVVQDAGGPLSLKIAVGIFLLIVFYLMLSVTYGAFRPAGLVAGALTAVLFSVQILLIAQPESRMAVAGDYVLFAVYVALMSVAIVIGLGLVWSKLLYRLTGQESKRIVGPAN
ncbi:MAG: hypothetical protein HQ483_19425 [Rhodospirillales bacterium]|nr:hypothetical protein [Rhodospirillales bacterium]